MYPPVVGVIRRTIRSNEIAGHQVEAHTVVQTSILGNHYLEKYWREPFKFDPMRFSDARQEHKQHPYLWAPFGGNANHLISWQVVEYTDGLIATQTGSTSMTNNRTFSVDSSLGNTVDLGKTLLLAGFRSGDSGSEIDVHLITAEFSDNPMVTLSRGDKGGDNVDTTKTDKLLAHQCLMFLSLFGH